MTIPFDPSRRTIIVRAEITGPTGKGTVDFLRGQILTIDFPKGEIALTPGGPTP